MTTPLNYTTYSHAHYLCMMLIELSGFEGPGNLTSSTGHTTRDAYDVCPVPMSAVIFVSNPSERIGISGV
jgi:hypothetical protein